VWCVDHSLGYCPLRSCLLGRVLSSTWVGVNIRFIVVHRMGGLPGCSLPVNTCAVSDVEKCVVIIWGIVGVYSHVCTVPWLGIDVLFRRESPLWGCVWDPCVAWRKSNTIPVNCKVFYRECNLYCYISHLTFTVH
jgi:hypothetical protein